MIKINGFEIDAALTENHSYSSDVTEHPVEKGADITDHVRAKPPTITIEGIVSDTPVGDLATRRSTTTLPSDDAIQLLRKIHTARAPISIETSKGVYKNVVMEMLAIPVDAETGAALRFRATFRQIEIVEVVRKVVKVAVPRSNKKQKLGAKAAKSSTAGETATPKSVGNLLQYGGTTAEIWSGGNWTGH